MPKALTTKASSSQGQETRSVLVSRFPFTRIQPTSSKSKKTATLVSLSLPPTKPSNELTVIPIQPRKRALSNASVETIRVTTKKKPSVLKKKRARENEESDADENRSANRQRTSSISCSAPTLKTQIFKGLGAGYAEPAAPVLTHHVPYPYPVSDRSESPDFSDFEPITPPPSPSLRVAIAQKSPDITREKKPKVPNSYEGSFFPVMDPHLKEYHDRFRSRNKEPSVALKDHSLNIIPNHLAPPVLVYESEEDSWSGDDWYQAPGVPENIKEIGNRHLDMSVSLKKPYFECWDMDDVQYIGLPAKLHFFLKDEQAFRNRSLPSRPDLRCIDITCQSFDYRCATLSSGDSVHRAPESPEYIAKYAGTTFSHKDQLAQPTAFSNGILIFDKWRKSAAARTGRSPTLDPTDDVDIASNAEDDEPQPLLKRKGWVLKVWIPVPVALFDAKESRAFQVDVQAWLGPEYSGGIVTAKTDVMISHLRTRKELGIRLSTA